MITACYRQESALLAFAAARRRRHMVPAALVAAMLGGAGNAAAQDREWSASGAYENVVATDCRQCGDDIGIMLACRAMGEPAEVTVHWSAVENGEEGAPAPIEFNVDGQRFNYEAITRLYGQIGYTPEFALAPGDPLLGALQSGRAANVRFGGGSIDIALRGSREALEIFKAHCGWNGDRVAAPARPEAGEANAEAAMPAPVDAVPTGAAPLAGASTGDVQVGRAPPRRQTVAPEPTPAGQPVIGQPAIEQPAVEQPAATATPVQPDQETAAALPPPPPPPPPPALGLEDGTWTFYSGGAQGQGPASHTLIYGIPETDATFVTAICDVGSESSIALNVQIMTGPSLPPGQTANVALATSSGTFTARAIGDGNGFPVAEARAGGGAIAGWWNAFLYPGTVGISIDGQPVGKIASMANSTEAGRFYDECRLR